MQLTSFIVAAALSAVAVAQQMTINTPTTPVVCQPLLISWAGGTPPYILSVVDGNNPTGAPILDLGSQTGTSFTWKVNQAPGKLGLKLIDSTGLTSQSAPFDAVAGSDSSCVGKTESSSAVGSASAPASSGPAASAPASSAISSVSSVASSVAPTTTAAPATTSSAAATSAKPSTTAAAGAAASSSAPAAPNGASVAGVNAGLLGIVGAAVLALMA